MIVNYELEVFERKSSWPLFLMTEEKAVIVDIEAGIQNISRIEMRNAIVWGRLLGIISVICYGAARCSSTDRETAKFKPLQIQGVY